MISQRSALIRWLRAGEDIPAFWLLLGLRGTNEKSHGLEHLDTLRVRRVIPHETLVLVRLKSLSSLLHDLGLFPREAGGSPRQPGREGREAVKSGENGDLGWRIMPAHSSLEVLERIPVLLVSYHSEHTSI